MPRSLPLLLRLPRLPRCGLRRAHPCHAGGQVGPGRLAGCEALAQVTRELNHLRVVKRVTERGHEADVARGGFADAAEHHLQQVVGPLAVQLAALAERQVQAEHLGAVARVVAGAARAFEQALG